MTSPEGANARQTSRRTTPILIGVVIVLYTWPACLRLLAGAREAPAFAVRLPEPPAPGTRPFKSVEFVSPEADVHVGLTDTHVGSICELPDGRLASAWYAGTAEGASDVSIYFATREANPGAPWSEPRRVVSRKTAARELGRHVRKVGNSILFVDREDRLWLVYVSVAVGGWSGSSLNVKMSTDGGDTWSPSRRLTLSPFLNVSELVRSKPLALEDGGFAVPIYHESVALFPEMLWIGARPGGRMSWRKTRIFGGRSFIQPAVVATGRRSAAAFFRCWSPDRAVGLATTSDGGLTWTGPRLTALPNPNAAVDALLLSGGRILLAFNDHESERNNLRLAVMTVHGPEGRDEQGSGRRGPEGRDEQRLGRRGPEGRDEQGSGRRGRASEAAATRVATLEEDPEERFSYPYLVRSRDGLIHIVYTWRGTRIKHVTLNEAWIEERLSERRTKEGRR